MKSIKVERACLVDGVHRDVGETLSVPGDVSRETAATLVRHGRASEEAEPKKPAGGAA